MLHTYWRKIDGFQTRITASEARNVARLKGTSLRALKRGVRGNPESIVSQDACKAAGLFIGHGGQRWAAHARHAASARRAAP